MARTQAADFDQKQDAIMQQATRLFARKSFAGASLADIAKQSGVSKSLIYHYYPSKEAILYDIMRRHVGELLETVEKAQDAVLDPAAQLEKSTRALLRRYVGASDAQKVLLYELEALPKRERSEIVAAQRALIDRIEAILLAHAPALASDRPALRARTMLYFGMINWSNAWFNAGGPISRDALADMAAQTALGGLAAAAQTAQATSK